MELQALAISIAARHGAYREDGAAGLTSRLRGKPSNHQLAQGLEKRTISLIQRHYCDFGPILAQEKLAEAHGLHLAKETVRRIMVDAGLWVPRKQRAARVHQPCNRRACRGELIQIDGSDHRWFEDRGPACTLLVYIDDATSQLMHLHFAEVESTFSYFTATRAYLERHGKPLAFYSDKASVFRSNHKEPQGGDGYPLRSKRELIRVFHTLESLSRCVARLGIGEVRVTLK